MKRADIFEYVKNKYLTEPEYLWKEHPKYAVLRHQDSRKWYAILMDVDKAKLDVTEDTGFEDLLDIKLPPETISNLQEFPEFLPAYHMNKTHWISVRLEFAKVEELTNLIDESFRLTE
ncbi:MmcQ/YjbR family DNA-binding protein [Weissella fangxianensis]|uniref:MmcQ/YjbR family DNA-binding protein n=1 Tax=Weissella fangxianensis TaxID=2953879 RepID=UPI002157D53A|nr:MmcQ/YjbR family DNA-binding protein [Weissella fangxianensis]